MVTCHGTSAIQYSDVQLQQVYVCIRTQNNRTRPNIPFAPLGSVGSTRIQPKNTVVKHDQVVHLLPVEYISVHSSEHVTNRSDLFNFLLLLASQSFELCPASFTPLATLEGHVARMPPAPIPHIGSSVDVGVHRSVALQQFGSTVTHPINHTRFVCAQDVITGARMHRFVHPYGLKRTDCPRAHVIATSSAVSIQPATQKV